MLNMFLNRKKTSPASPNGSAPVGNHIHQGSRHLEFLKLGSKLVSLVQQAIPLQESGVIFTITSATPGEGKSFVTESLAINMAQQANMRILLVNASASNPVWSEEYTMLLDESSTDPYQSIEAGTERQLDVYYTKHVNLHFGSFVTHNNSTTFADPSNILNLYRDLKQRFDIILVDGKSLREEGTYPLLELADHVVLVVDSSSSKREVLRAYLDEMDSLKEKILGVVLNKNQHYIPSAIYERL